MRNTLLVLMCGVMLAAPAGCARKAKSLAAPPPPAPPAQTLSQEPLEAMVWASAPAPPGVLPIQTVTPDFNTEAYDRIDENPFLAVSINPLSTFSIDVDTASYSNVRRFLTSGEAPPKDAVRIEELVNYFDYAYAPPQNGDPFAVRVDVALCPWKKEHRLARVAIKGREVPMDKRPKSNLVFLLDVSGSMDEPNKLPLVKRAMGLLIDQLQPSDRVGIVVYAGASGLLLPSTRCTEDGKEEISEALESLVPHGSTAGSEGIRLAYKTAENGLLENGTNRVILCTDGDFNVGVTNEGDLTRLIEEKARSGVFLSVLGFGMGNLKDSTLEKLADKGNGQYGYIDTYNEARKAFVEQLSGTLITIAKDVKIQVEFNPAKVSAYRLIGYENRLLRDEDFNDDTKDAGDIGAGHTVTALYELVPVGVKFEGPGVDPLVFQKPVELTTEAQSGDLMAVKLRYKEPKADASQLITHRVPDATTGEGDPDFRFATAVAEFGLMLRDSPHKGDASYDDVLSRAQSCLGEDPHGYRAEFLTLVHKAKSLQRN